MSFVDSRICRRLVCGSSICSIRICAACTPSANVSTSTLVMGVSARLRQRRVVAADDAELLWYPQPQLMRGPQRTERQPVVAANDGVRRVVALQEHTDAVHAALNRRQPVENKAVRDGQMMRGKLAAVARDAILIENLPHRRPKGRRSFYIRAPAGA